MNTDAAGWLTVKTEATASLTERKSEFIGSIKPIQTEEEAIAFVSSVKKRYADARHNVYAYLVRENSIARFSDDGEPHGTAGMPILDVLRKENVTNVALVVTRYFGGILLGTGGLVRAYSQCAKLALDKAEIAQVVPLTTFTLQVGYADLQKIEPVLNAKQLLRLDAAYTNEVCLTLAIRSEEYDALASDLTDRTGGRALLTVTGTKYDCL